MEHGDDKVKANAAGALGNMARNSNELCSDLIGQGAVKVRVRYPPAVHHIQHIKCHALCVRIADATLFSECSKQCIL